MALPRITIENKINLLRPAKDGPFRVVANVVKPGRTVIVSEGELFDSGESWWHDVGYQPGGCRCDLSTDRSAQSFWR